MIDGNRTIETQNRQFSFCFNFLQFLILFIVTIGLNDGSLAFQGSNAQPAEVASPPLEEYAELVFNSDGKSHNAAEAYRRFLRTEEATDREINDIRWGLLRAIQNKENQVPSFYIIKHLLESETVVDKAKLQVLDSLTGLYDRTHLSDNDLNNKIKDLFLKLQDAGNERFDSKIKRALDQAKALEDALMKIGNAEIRLFEFSEELEKMPRPVDQSVAARTKTLKEQIKAALALVEAGKDLEFVNRFVSPISFALGERTPEGFARSYLINLNRLGRRQYLVDELKGQLEGDLNWDLGGRAAWIPKVTKSIWIYQEGHWLMLPFSGHGGLPKMPPPRKIDFFDDSNAYPKTSIATVFASDEARLESLRKAQKQLLEISSDADKRTEMLQYYFCPVSYAVFAASCNTTVGELYALFQTPKPGPEGQLEAYLAAEMKRQMSLDPVWTPSGRVAAFPPPPNPAAKATWRFYEGRWRFELPK